MRHGTTSGYRRGCRCGDCLRAVREYQEGWRRRRGIPPAKRPPHPSRSSYNLGCRCEDCRREEREYRRRWRVRRQRGTFPPAETLAYLSCLRSLGFPVSAVARAAGLSETALYELAKGRTRRVYAATREGLYRAHWAAWLHSGEFRLHCRCDVPRQVGERIESEEVLA